MLLIVPTPFLFRFFFFFFCWASFALRSISPLAMASEPTPTPSPPHLLIVAFPSQGHVIPAIGLARVLASAGFHLTLLSAQHSIAHFHQQHLPHIHCVGLPTPPILRPSNPDTDGPVSGLLRMVENSQRMSVDFEQWMEKLVSGSLPEVSSFGPLVAIISDHFCPWTQAVATKLGIPRYVLYTSPAKLLALLFYFPSLVAAGRLPLRYPSSDDSNAADAAAVKDSILVPGLGSIPLAELPSSLKDSSSQLMHQFCHGSACRLHEAAGVFVNSFQDLEPRALDAMNLKTLNPNGVPIFSIGPIPPHPFFADQNQLVSHSTAESSKDIIGWLDSQSHSPVLYISFGTVYMPSEAQIYEIAVGLQSSQLPFLWVLRSASTADSANPPAIFNFLPEGFEQHSQKHGMIISSWAPQPLILSHPSIGGFLTHCGWNSTIESICSGVPMIAYPQMTEQQLICGMVVDEWKVGLRVERGNDGLVRGAELERQARRLLTKSEEGMSIRKRISEMRKAARRAIIEEDGSSASSLQAFIRDIAAK